MKRHHICSEEADFVKHKRETTSWFLKHGYPEIGIKIEVAKIRLRQRLRRRREGIKQDSNEKSIS